MKVIVQKCENAKVKVKDKIVGSSDFGLMLLVGFTFDDNEQILEKMARKIVNLRIFEDENNVMNKSLLDVKGTILSVSQFTLYADTSKGNRPSYIKALNGDKAKILYDKFNLELKKYTNVETGIFGEDMKVEFTNLGPTTIILEIRSLLLQQK